MQRLHPKPYTRNPEQGQALITAVIFFLVGSLLIVAGIAGPVVRDIRTIGDAVRSKQSYLFAEGATEDVMYRVQNAQSVDNTETLTDGDFEATVTIEDEGGERQITAVGDQNDLFRKVYTTLSLGEGTTFNYGIQTDTGGLNLSNNAAVHGNVFTNGNLFASNGGIIYGDAIVSGSHIFSAHATGTVYSHTIYNAQVGGDAYYQSLISSTVDGTKHPGSPDQEPLALPDLSEEIAQWEAAAEAGGSISGESCQSGEYDIDSNTTLGPVKIECDLKVNNGVTITLFGNVWVDGDIDLNNNVTFQVDPSLGGSSVAVIADSETDDDNSSKISISNNVDLHGSGSGSSSIMFVSLNNSFSEGSGSAAVNYSNNGGDNSAIFFVPYGLINFSNNASVSSVTAYKANVSNNTEIRYNTGLANLLFTSGPGGSYTLQEWKEVE